MDKLDPKSIPSGQKRQLKYEQIKRMLLDQMAQGKLHPGDMLPPEVELAQQMGIARNTVRQAMRELEQMKLIRRVRGKGTIVCDVEHGTTDPPHPGTQLFGLVLPELRTGLYQSLQAGLTKTMSSSGANMIVCDSDQDLHHQIDAVLQLAHRKVSGIAMVPITSAPTPAHHLTFLQRSRLPLVFCHRRIEGVSAPLVGFSAHDIGYTAGQELGRHNHRRVAMIFSHASESCERRVSGARKSLREVGGEIPDEFIYYDRSFRADSLPEGLLDRLVESIRAMLRHPQPPTAFIASADILAGMTCLALHKLGLNIPDDASVIGFGDRFDRNTVQLCRLQSVTVDEGKLGQIAFSTLREIQLGQLPLDSDKEIFMPLQISEGDSIGPAKTATPKDAQPTSP